MFSDTITFTDIHGTEDVVLRRVNQDKYSSEYKLLTDAKLYRLFIRNTTRVDKATKLAYERHNVEFTEQVFPAVVGSPPIMRKAYFTFEVQLGDVLTGPVQLATGLLGWAIADSSANLTKLVGSES